jgi:Domain of unknown function (DUF1841)
VDDGPEARRAFAIPPATGEFDGIDLSELDPADPDDRTTLIEAEHPEMPQDEDEIVGPDGSTFNPRLHVAMHEVVAKQLWDGDPSEVWATARRLLGLGYERHEILHMLAHIVSAQVYDALARHQPYDRDRHLAALAALPDSWEAERGQAARLQRPRPSARPGKRRRKGGGGKRRR